MPRSLVESVLAGGAWPSEAADRLDLWIEELTAWNRKVDLTAARTPEELVDLMVADAALLASRLGQRTKVVDVGSGAGSPGLPLSILRPDLDVTLVEPLDKRVAFLRRAIGIDVARRTGDRRPLRVVRGRGESVVGRETFDVAVSRATLEPAAWLSLGDLLAPAGQVWVLLARGEPPAHPRRRAEADIAYTWPLTGAPRRAVSYVLTDGEASGTERVDGAERDDREQG